ncbi:NAC domain-containing protein 68-like [Ananas comosus]|uniref:NAC domain-containing protein 68-like n=1 Tax=Ananas comosus TaxID=4615 RepID=A0A6P5ETM2_ANACO|nr:NAC domain-containing protein 68-like [Ananas comosus]
MMMNRVGIGRVRDSELPHSTPIRVLVSMVQQCHPSSHGRALWLRRPWQSRSEASLPLGFIFNPKDEELIVHYLCAYPAGRWDHVVEAEVYSTRPWSLLGDDSKIGYFLTKRTRHGNRVKRTTGGGHGPAKPRKKRSCPPAVKSLASKRCSRSVLVATATAPRNHPRRPPDM